MLVLAASPAATVTGLASAPRYARFWLTVGVISGFVIGAVKVVGAAYTDRRNLREQESAHARWLAHLDTTIADLSPQELWMLVDAVGNERRRLTSHTRTPRSCCFACVGGSIPPLATKRAKKIWDFTPSGA
ncbi:MAG: hypothetical protein NVS4B3_19980 [Gemmatimonadaceae bacterium]